MLNKHTRMRLSPEEEAFLRRWAYDEARYQEGVGPAKRLQVQHGVTPADLAVVIAAAHPEPAEQEAMAIQAQTVTVSRARYSCGSVEG